MKSFYMHDKSLAEIEAEVGAPLLAEIAELHQIIDDLQPIIDKQDEELDAACTDLAFYEQNWQDFVSAAAARGVDVDYFNSYDEVFNALGYINEDISAKLDSANLVRNELIETVLQEHSAAVSRILGS